LHVDRIRHARRDTVELWHQLSTGLGQRDLELPRFFLGPSRQNIIPFGEHNMKRAVIAKPARFDEAP
jgi:hypothetical protein